jgi:hypothetical protein
LYIGDNNIYTDLTDQEHCDRLYSLKNKVLNKLIQDKSIKYLGYTKTWNGYYGTSYWGCYSFCGKSYHIQTEKPQGRKLRPLESGVISSYIDKNKAKGLKVFQAIKILENFFKTI